MTARMPAAFVGHGSPMNALEHNRFTEAWRSLGARLPRPRAILVISAHWFINATAVTAMPAPRTIHDFYGFPDELFAVQYPSPGLPGLAEEVAELARPVWVGADEDSWGIDHGAWSVLVHMFPDAEVPVVQLAIDATQPLEYHVELGARLAPLCDDGVFLLGSGNVVHNLRLIDWERPEGGFEWAHRFDDRARELMTSDPSEVSSLVDHPDYPLAVPSTDHFVPLLHLAGVAAGRGETARTLVDGCAMGSLSMISYTVGLDDQPTPDSTRPAAEIPEGPVPPERTNT